LTRIFSGISYSSFFTKDCPESKGALEKLISCLIGQTIFVTTITANEPPIDSLKDRQIRFDINCKSEFGELINIEMTLYPDNFEPVRLEFYAGKLFTSQDIRGKNKTFDDLKPAYQITFLVNKSCFNDIEIIHNFEYYDQKNKVSLGGRSRIITVELNKLDKIIDKPVEKMTTAEHRSVFFRYITDTTKRQTINKILEIEEGIAMASEVLISISKDEVERARLMSEYKFEEDHQSKLIQTERRARAEAHQEFLALLNSGKSLDEIKSIYNKEK
jgi:predicted transposase/invertase (TIGR01784 family)